MNTEQMIRALASKACPVSRPERPVVLFSRWITVTVLYLATGVMLIGTRGDLAHVWHSFGFLFHTLVVASLTLLAAISAFVLSIPDQKLRWAAWMPAVAVAVWLAWIVGVLVAVGDLGAGAGTGRKCLQNIVALSLPTGLLMYHLLGRAAPLRTSITGWLAALSASAAADLATRFICRHDHASHALVWHFAPVLAISCAGLLWGRVLLKWDSPNSQ
jgi:hypothetical protein